jgi:hypothetical protein
MARVTAMLVEAQTAGLDVHRDGSALVVRGPDDQWHQVCALLGHEPLVLAVLNHEEECRGHEHTEHLGQSVDWRLAGGRLVSGACRPALIADKGGEPVDVPAATGGNQPAAGPACPMCGSAGRCDGRIATPEGGWACLAAVADGLVRNGRHIGPGQETDKGGIRSTRDKEQRSEQTALGGRT